MRFLAMGLALALLWLNSCSEKNETNTEEQKKPVVRNVQKSDAVNSRSEKKVANTEEKKPVTTNVEKSDAVKPIATYNAVDEALERVNYYRKMTGLPAAPLNAHLNKAAEAHAEYLVTNYGKEIADKNANYGAVPDPHGENRSKKGFTGPTEVERIMATGYDTRGKAGSAEDIVFWVNPRTAVDDWMSALYHRVRIIDPLLADVGFCFKEDPTTKAKVDVMEFVSAISVRGEPCVVYPAENQNDVPTTSPCEFPNPRPDGSMVSGYEITMTLGVGYGRFINCTSSSLVDSKGKAVDYFLVTPHNDVNRLLNSTVAIIPKSPLAGGEKYTVTLAVKTMEGREVKKEWSFTTKGK